MTLKNSFLVRLIENNKRRLWLIVVSILLFVIAMPITTAMEISLIQEMEKEIGLIRVQMRLYNQMEQTFSFNSLNAILAGCFAVLSAMQGFSYLYDRSKIDFYHSKPVKTSQRFLTIWSNGILIYAIPMIIGNLINVVLSAVAGIMDGALFLAMCEGIVLCIGFYLTIYSVAILAVMLTGKALITLMGTVILLCYEMAVRAMIDGMRSFYFHFYYGNANEDRLTPVVSPFRIIDRYWNQLNELNVVSGSFSLIGLTFLDLVLFAAVFLALAYWCYKKRPAELAGSAMTFQPIKPIIKIAITVPVAILALMATAGLMGYSPVYGSGSSFFPILMAVIFLVLSCCLIQVIYEADIKAMFRKKSHILISAVITFVILAVFRYDLAGYDNRIPDMNEIDSVAIITDSPDRYARLFYDENMKTLSKEEYADKNMYLTGEDAQNVRDLALICIEEYQKYPNRKAFDMSLNEETYNEYSDVAYIFRLKNGKEIARNIPVLLRHENVRSLLEQIENSENFIKGNDPAFSERFYNAVQNNEYGIMAACNAGMIHQDITVAQAKQLLDAYRADVMNLDTYQIKSTELPVAQFGIMLQLQTSYMREVVMMIYPSYENCMNFLNENGFVTDQYADVNDIQRIEIRKYYESEEETIIIEETAGFEEAVAVTMEGTWESKDYADPEKMQQILDHAYPANLEWDFWHQSYPFDENEYSITVFFDETSDYYSEYGAVADFYFLKDQVPDFVLEDIPLETK